ncbi:hypothetical protein CLU79DRAFT_767629 [Phycomyces nitens]|nr:hypothetical protein CLU79DRAFT_767629 [Phycomyces nitens]
MILSPIFMRISSIRWDIYSKYNIYPTCYSRLQMVFIEKTRVTNGRKGIVSFLFVH